MKKKIKKLIIVFVMLCTSTVYSQDKGDLGIVLSTNYSGKVALEYRTAEKGQYRMRFGYTYANGDRRIWNSNFYPNSIVSASDSLIVYRVSSRFQQNHELRFGFERQFGSSIFSAVADLTLGINRQSNYSYNRPYILTESGWHSGTFVSEDYDSSGQDHDGNLLATKIVGENMLHYTRRHFLVPGIRLGVNMDLPIKKAFVFHTGIYSSFKVPIYMGTSYFIDQTNSHFGTPSAVFLIDVNAEIGIRYNIGSFKNRTRRVKP